jgi:hypothetical protein
VPREWCQLVDAAPTCTWTDAGTSGRKGSFWESGGTFKLMAVSDSHNPPSDFKFYELREKSYVITDEDLNRVQAVRDKEKKKHERERLASGGAERPVITPKSATVNSASNSGNIGRRARSNVARSNSMAADDSD